MASAACERVNSGSQRSERERRKEEDEAFDGSESKERHNNNKRKEEKTNARTLGTLHELHSKTKPVSPSASQLASENGGKSKALFFYLIISFDKRE